MLFCADLREGILLLCGLEMLASVYWLGSLGTWPSSRGLRDVTLAALCVNSVLGVAAVNRESERIAFGLMCAYVALICCLFSDFAVSHPSSCSAVAESDDTQLGMLLSHLLWTVDACLLMSILGWVTIGVGWLLAFWLGYLILSFWRMLRVAGADRRLVSRAIASLPVVRYNGKDTPIPLLEGREPSEITACAICLGDFDAGEELRILPCVHLYHKPCIDLWIRRQGLSATCPLCKRGLVPQPRRNAGVAGGAGTSRRRQAGQRSGDAAATTAAAAVEEGTVAGPALTGTPPAAASQAQLEPLLAIATAANADVQGGGRRSAEPRQDASLSPARAANEAPHPLQPRSPAPQQQRLLSSITNLQVEEPSTLTTRLLPPSSS